MKNWNPEQAEFLAKIEAKMIKIHAGGAWRNMHQWPYNRIPSEKIQRELLHRIWLNTGKSFNEANARLIWG